MSNTQKVKVIEIEATKLDPNAVYLIIFSELQLNREQMRDMAEQLKKLGIKAAYQMAKHPEDALKVYQIPQPQTPTNEEGN